MAIKGELNNNNIVIPQIQKAKIFSSHKHVKELKLEDFKVLKNIGNSNFGKVFLVKYLPTHELYVMKSLKKDIFMKQQQIENTLLKKEILESIYYPFIFNIIFIIETEERIYFIMEFLSGGDLNQNLRKFRTFEEDKVRVYGVQIALALEYLYKYGIVYIVYGELKLKNILIDDKGYLKLVYFDIFKKSKNEDLNNGFYDIQEYLAPEVIKEENFGKEADWWSFGTLLFEMLCGLPPFYEKHYEISNNNLVKFPKKLNLSDDAKDIINKLLDNNPKKRLGSQNGIEEIKTHPFFANIDFDLIEKKKIPSPYIPDLVNDIDEENLPIDIDVENLSNDIDVENLSDDIDVENLNAEFKMKLNKYYIY